MLVQLSMSLSVSVCLSRFWNISESLNQPLTFLPRSNLLPPPDFSASILPDVEQQETENNLGWSFTPYFPRQRQDTPRAPSFGSIWNRLPCPPAPPPGIRSPGELRGRRGSRVFPGLPPSTVISARSRPHSPEPPLGNASNRIPDCVPLLFTTRPGLKRPRSEGPGGQCSRAASPPIPILADPARTRGSPQGFPSAPTRPHI